MAKKTGKYVTLKDHDKAIKLSKGEQALLSVLRKPSSITMTVEQLCEAAGIDDSTYYRAFKKDDFKKVVQQECAGIATAAVIPVMNRVREMALTSKNHHWSRMLLEMVGVYVPTGKGTNQPTQINFVVNLGVERPKVSQPIEVEGEVVNDV